MPRSADPFPAVHSLYERSPATEQEAQLQRHSEGISILPMAKYTFSMTSLGRVAQMGQRVSQQSARRQSAPQVHISTLNLWPAEFVCQSV